MEERKKDDNLAEVKIVGLLVGFSDGAALYRAYARPEVQVKINWKKAMKKPYMKRKKGRKK